MNINWNYKDPYDPHPEEIAREANGMALADLYDDKGQLIAKKGQQLSSFAQLA
jgi:formate dehydrogenase major subunit/formate dehydrogenase-N alpha subunit